MQNVYLYSALYCNTGNIQHPHPVQVFFQRPNVVKHNRSRVFFALAWVGLPWDGCGVYHNRDFGRELLMPTNWITRWLTVDSDIHLGNFNQHRQWLQSLLRASVTLTNCDLFYIAASPLFSVALFSTYSSTAKGYVALGLLYLLQWYESKVSAMLLVFHNQPLIFFSNAFKFNVCHVRKTGSRFLLWRSRIHVSPFLLSRSSRIRWEPVGNRFFCRLVAGHSGRMLGWHGWSIGTVFCVKCDHNLSQIRYQPFCIGDSHRSPDKRYSCFPGHNMAIVP